MNKLTLEQLEQNLVKWRKERRIDELSTAKAQHNCYLEELDEFKDAIGDMVVCLLNEMSFHEKSDAYESDDSGAWCAHKICGIQVACGVAGVDFEECLAMAWNEIEHRVGLMRSTGKFTKWKDLTHPERVTVALSGQLIGKPREVIEDCRRHCTAPEWDEITAAELSVTEA